MKKFATITLLLFSFFVFSENAQARVLPQAAKSGKQTSIKATGTNISVSPRIRADRRALIVNFSNLQNATYVSYLLTYKTSGQQEGATGALNLSEVSNQTSELLFGTCSKNVCRYHTNITDARLEVPYTNKAGKKYLKKYKIKL